MILLRFSVVYICIYLFISSSTADTFFAGLKRSVSLAWNYAKIFPGTKWCGDGRLSTSYDELGPNSETDKCCRAHDLCPEHISAGETNFGLTNTGRFTRSNCVCDREFHECLKRVNSFISRSVQIGYFNVLKPKCFTKAGSADKYVWFSNYREDLYNL